MAKFVPLFHLAFYKMLHADRQHLTGTYLKQN